MSVTIDGRGTDERTWAPWLEQLAAPDLDISSLAGRRVVALAAHPDDEVLGAGGLLSALSAAGSPVVAVWATDGEASHPDSTAITPDALRERRRVESRDALRQLGVSPIGTHHLALPDSGLTAMFDALGPQVAALLSPGDVVLTPWRGDGHPDHEAVGRAAAEACDRVAETTLVEYPIWMWHWAAPGDERVPWQAMRSVRVSCPAAKAAAIDAFHTQVRPIGPEVADDAILPPHVVARFVRDREVVIA